MNLLKEICPFVYVTRSYKCGSCGETFEGAEYFILSSPPRGDGTRCTNCYSTLVIDPAKRMPKVVTSKAKHLLFGKKVNKKKVDKIPLGKEGITNAT